MYNYNTSHPDTDPTAFKYISIVEGKKYPFYAV